MTCFVTCSKLNLKKKIASLKVPSGNESGEHHFEVALLVDKDQKRKKKNSKAVVDTFNMYTIFTVHISKVAYNAD